MNLNNKKLSETDDKSINEYIKSNLPEMAEKDLPEIITGQFSKLKELDSKTREANKAANYAKDAAKSAKKLDAGWFKKQKAIEGLQSAGLELAKAVELGADAQKLSFEFQEKLAKISKYLFGLGASNIAINRFVVRELELRLKGASEEELSELARQELIAVVKQLKAQEDVLKKQESFSKSIKTHDEKFSLQSEKNKEIEETLNLNLEIVTSKIDNIDVKLNSDIQGVNAKIDNVSGKLNSDLELAHSKLQEVEGNLNSDLDVAFSKIQEVEKEVNSELIFSNVEINKNRKKINLLMILLIINILAVISSIIFFTKFKGEI